MEMLSNNRTKELAKLQQKKYRLQSDFALVEGKRLITQLHQNNIFIDELFCLKTDISKFQYLNPGKITTCSDFQIQKFTDTKNSQNIAALVKIPHYENLNIGFSLYLDNIKEPGNLGTIFRTAAAFQIDSILLSQDCCEVFNPKTVRASLGSVFSVPFTLKSIDFLKNTDADIICTVLKDSVPLTSINSLKKPLILVIGSEAHGISQKIIDIADKKIFIPMDKRMESLNASIAAAISIFYLQQVIS